MVETLEPLIKLVFVQTNDSESVEQVKNAIEIFSSEYLKNENDLKIENNKKDFIFVPKSNFKVANSKYFNVENYDGNNPYIKSNENLLKIDGEFSLDSNLITSCSSHLSISRSNLHIFEATFYIAVLIYDQIKESFVIAFINHQQNQN